MIGKAIYAQLHGTVAVAALVGTRIDPQFNPKTVRPSIVYTQDSIDRDRTYAGDRGIAKVNTTITALAATYSSVISVAAEIVTALDDQGGTWGTVEVLNATVDDEDEQVTMLDAGTDTPIYAKSMSVSFWIRP